MKHLSMLFLFISFVLSCIPAFAAEKTIGVIMTGDLPYYKEIHKAFTESLATEGFGGGNVEIILQTPAPSPMAWTNAARKLIAYGANVIVSYGAPATIAVIEEASDIPVIFAGVYSPQALNLAGKKASGVSSGVSIAGVLKNFKDLKNFSTLGVVFNDAEKDTVLQANEIKQLEGRFGFRSVRFNIKNAVDSSKIANIDALFLTTSYTALQCVNNILDIARKAKIPTAAIIAGGKNSGIILTIIANPSEQGSKAAKLTAKVIRGANPSSLPVEQPQKIDIIINMKEASDMGLKVPFELLTSATEVIK